MSLRLPKSRAAGGSPAIPTRPPTRWISQPYVSQPMAMGAAADGGAGAAVRAMTEEEVDAMLENFAQEDRAMKKTWTRLVVEKFLSKVRRCAFEMLFPCNKASVSYVFERFPSFDGFLL